MMILHIIPDEKWTQPFIEKINMLFSSDDHFFWVYSNQKIKYFDLEDIKKYPNIYVYVGKVFGGNDICNIIRKCDLVILHSLFFQLSDLVSIAKIENVKTVWFIWGGDLYDTYYAAHTFPFNPVNIIREHYRKKIISKLTGVIAIDGDYQQLRTWYHTNAKQLFAQYTYKLVDKKSNAVFTRKKEKIRILVGHSATRTCQHILVFNILAKFAGKVEIISPLAYPSDKSYIDKVIRVGTQIFGNDFIPMTNYMNYDEYIAMLSGIDIAVFNNNRQQGNGNIISMLYLGKKVYVSSQNSLYSHYKQLGCSIFEFSNNIDDSFLDLLNSDEAAINEAIIINQFCDKAFVSTWSHVFSL